MEKQVLIVGAGPTGLVLALWLAKSGVPLRIIEKNDGPGQASRAMAVQARTLEFYRQLGIADQVIAGGIPFSVGHLREGSRVVANFRFDDIAADISPYPFVLSYPQDDHERLLVKCLEAAGIRVEWNTQLIQFKDEGQSVKTTLKKNGTDEACEFSYVCGCDGARSTVRQELGLNFPGGTYDQIFYVADAQVTGVNFDPALNACISPDSFCIVFPVRSTGMFRLIGIVPKELAGKEDLTMDDLRPYLKKQINVDVQKVNWFSRYHVHHRVADHFRQGRVFIAGDAGHIHSPAGGQGMNTGIGDAVNLAWKLAAVIRGRAKPAILDTYESERIAFARLLVSTTDRLFQVAIGRDLKTRIIRRSFLRYLAPMALRFKAARTAQFRLVSQIRINYRDSSALNSGSAGKMRGGDRLPWVASQNNFQPLNSLDWQIHIYGVANSAFRGLSARWRLPLCVFESTKQTESAGFVPDALYLVRPDGHIALAQPEQNLQELERYLSQWLMPSSS